jgi:hypothetical protein
MGYDVDFVQLDVPPGTALPVEGASAKKLLKGRRPLTDTVAARAALLKVQGSKPGPNDAVDYVGAGLNYARLFIRPDAIHVENNCGVRELLKIYDTLKAALPGLLILDLQSGIVHDGASLQQWWARPL